jgi:hypothetical protein
VRDVGANVLLSINNLRSAVSADKILIGEDGQTISILPRTIHYLDI